MLYIVVMLVVAWLWILPLQTWAEESLVGADLPVGSQKEENLSHEPVGPFIAGIPHEEVLVILSRHQEELLQLPGVQGLGLGDDGLYVYTDNPAVLPAQVEGLPVKPLPLQKLPAQLPSSREPVEVLPPSGTQEKVVPLTEAPPVRELPSIAGIPYEEAQAIVERHREDLMQVPGVYDVGIGDGGIIAGITIHSPDQTINSEALKTATKDLPTEIEGLPVKIKPLPILPPPPGVIVLRSGGVREAADTCPEGFIEYVQFGWRFCLDQEKPESIPALMTPPIAGIPFEEAQAILERHREDLMKLPGVQGFGLGVDGIDVWTENPTVVPQELEGLPVKARPPLGPLRGANHSRNTRIRPLHGGLAVADNLWQNTGTLTGVALSQGKSWLIFPAHLILNCNVPSPCPPAQTLPSPPANNCPHNVIVQGTQLLIQPVFTSPELVGFIQRWDVLQRTVNTTDSAAAFMDNDSVEGNMSLHADRRLEMWGNFTGIDRQPVMNEIVQVVTQNLPHGVNSFRTLVTNINVGVSVIFNCSGQNNQIPLISQIILEAFSPSFFAGDDSGSPVVDGAGSIVGMVNWLNIANPVMGGGTLAPVVRQKMGFDVWYGTHKSGFALRCN
jgi:hypothetical protein